MRHEITGTLQVRVTTRASRNLVKAEAQPDGSTLFRVYVTVVPDNGKANEAVIELLSREFRLPKSAFTIVQGHTARNKVVRVER